MRRWVRDALSGRFTTKEEAKEWPATTVEETDDYTAALAGLRWRITELEAVMLDISGDLLNMVMHKSATDDKLIKAADKLDEVARNVIPEEKA